MPVHCPAPPPPSRAQIRFAGLKDQRSEDVMPYADLNQTVSSKLCSR